MKNQKLMALASKFQNSKSNTDVIPESELLNLKGGLMPTGNGICFNRSCNKDKAEKAKK